MISLTSTTSTLPSTQNTVQTTGPGNSDNAESAALSKIPSLPFPLTPVGSEGTSEQQKSDGNALGETNSAGTAFTSGGSQVLTTDLWSGNGGGGTPSNSVGLTTASASTSRSPQDPKQTNGPAKNIGSENSGLASDSQPTPAPNPNGTSTSTEPGTITSPTGKPTWSHSSKGRAGAIIGGVIGGAVFALLSILLGVCLLRRRKVPLWERFDPFPRHGNYKADDHTDVIEPEARFLDAGVGVQSPTRESLIHSTTHDHSNDEPRSSSYDNTSVRAVLPSRTSADTDDEEEKYTQVAKRIPRGRTRQTPPVVHTEYTLDDPFSDGSPVHFVQSSSPSFAFPAIDSGLSSMLVDGTYSQYQASHGRNTTSGTEWEAERTGLYAEIEQLRSECTRLESIAGLPPPAYECSVR
ncbi:hypothetical protein VKT23_000296 [Stygiomarasmius scandens]|uniref:Uncharacterized protein n=1 Tax=Marasmiellus scandens TaxID=2682957 RepID=A0ABR1K6C7_9AGAR